MFAKFFDIESAVLQKNLQSGRDILDIFQSVASFYGRIEEGVRDTKEVSIEDRWNLPRFDGHTERGLQ